jgi:murein DD-endopeptidase MepM/ murein hydrolase activator NlpD
VDESHDRFGLPEASAAKRQRAQRRCKSRCSKKEFLPKLKVARDPPIPVLPVRLHSTPLVAAATILALALATPAFGADGGGVAAPDKPTQTRKGAKQRPGKSGSGGGARLRRTTLLTSFELHRKRLFFLGRSARVEFTLTGRRAAKVRLHVLTARDRSRLATIDLGEREAGSHSVSFTGLETGTALAEGRYLLHIAGRNLRRAPGATTTAELEFRHHTFPVAGPFSWGDEGSRFGAPRKGHRHQGQDLAAAEGTPVVAPRGGVVETVQYQPRGAGHYVVLDGEGEDYDYAFMHLRSGSIPVVAGQRVRTGQLIGEVGNTGASSGPHLHFEIWLGGWYAGGEPIDPLPLLQSWASRA